MIDNIKQTLEQMKECTQGDELDVEHAKQDELLLDVIHTLKKNVKDAKTLEQVNEIIALFEKADRWYS